MHHDLDVIELKQVNIDNDQKFLDHRLDKAKRVHQLSLTETGGGISATLVITRIAQHVRPSVKATNRFPHSRFTKPNIIT